MRKREEEDIKTELNYATQQYLAKLRIIGLKSP